MLFKNQSIQKKMIISTLLVTIIPLLVLEIVFARLIQANVLEHVLNSASVYVDQLEYNYQKELDTLEQTAQSMADFPILENYLQGEYISRGEAFDYYLANIHPLLSSHNRIGNGIGVRIYHNYSQITNYSFELNNGLDGFVQNSFPDGFQFQNEGFWRRDSIRYNVFKSAFSYYLPVRETVWPHGISYVIAIHMDEAFLNSQIVAEQPKDKLIFVTDKEGAILTTNQREFLGKSVREFSVSGSYPFMEIPENEQITLDGKEYIYMHRDAEDFHIYQLVAYDTILSAQRMSMVTLLAVGIGMMLVVLVLVIGVSKEITKGIEDLKGRMLNINRESIRTLAAYDLVENSKDEVKQLEVVFASMMGEIDILMDKLQFQELHLKDAIITRQQAEMQALQRQIDPHYLFNTLESIRMNLIIKGNREDAEIVKLFAESFRRYVDTGEDYATLFEEVAFIRKYMRIQNYRTSGKIHFRCEAEENVLQYRIPKLILQPLIENAVCHGVENIVGEAEVVLRISPKEGMLVILIEDDGIGMDTTELEYLRARVYDMEPGKSVGMQNVYRRIQLIYGERAEFLIESEKGIGTKVQLQLPLDILEGSVCYEF